MIDCFWPNFGCSVENLSEIRKDEEVFDPNNLDPFSSTSNLGFEDHAIFIPSQTSSTDIQNTPTIEPDSQSDQALLTPNENDGFEVLDAVFQEIFPVQNQQRNQLNCNSQAKKPEPTNYDRYHHIPGYLTEYDDVRYQKVKEYLVNKFGRVPVARRLHKIFERFCNYLHMHELFKQYCRAARKKVGVMFTFFTNHSQEFRMFLAQTFF